MIKTKVIISSLLIFQTFILTGCSHRLAVNQNCTQNCLQNAKKCSKFEHFMAESCKADPSAYKINVKEQKLIGLEITRDFNSYHDPLQCSRKISDCNEDYQMCVQLCKGMIYKRLVSPVA